jgi:hypothetical protein
MDLHKHTRRDFLRLAGLTTAGLVAAACAQTPEVAQQPTAAPTMAVGATAAPQPTATTAAPAATAAPTAEPEAVSRYQESPMLAERVSRGDLPPVDERLPEDVRVSRCESRSDSTAARSPWEASHPT